MNLAYNPNEYSLRRASCWAGLFVAVLILTSACGPIAPQEIAVITPLPPAPTEDPNPATPTPVPPTATVASAAETPTPTAEATPTPFNLQMPAGSAAAIAEATDVAMKPDIETRLTFDESPVPITFDEFYDGFDMRKGLTLSEKLKSLDGERVVMQGYMAPPLKPELDWFVLTQIRLAFCPFCSSDADWPTDIAVIYLTDNTVVATQAPVRIEGRMEIGSSIDPETGMVSLVRIYADKIDVIRS